MEATIPELAPEASLEGPQQITVPWHVGGQDEVSASTFEVISPFTGKSVWKASDASTADAVRCVQVAQDALASWSATHPKERQKILLKAADIQAERCEEISAIWRTETGSSHGMTSGFATPWSVDFIRAYAAKATTIQGTIPCTDEQGQSAMVWKVPVGVVLSVLPWNAPPVFMPRAIAAPLAAGCTAVVKSSDVSPRTYYALAKCYIDAGVPAGVVNLISCRAETAPQIVTTLIEQPAIRKVMFTGSTAVGRRIASTAALHLKPVILELGGKNSAIVLEDANLETAAVQIILGAFLNTGQTCMSTDRIVVMSKIASQFEAVFSAVLGKMFRSGNAPNALVNGESRSRVADMILEAKKKGATVLDGDWTMKDATEPSAAGKFENGIFVRPIVLKNIDRSMKVWSEEIFGSVVTIIPVDTEEEAIKVANDTEYGLSQAIFTEDLRKGLRIAKAVESGQIHINSMTLHEAPELPFGGVKSSGWGRVNGGAGIEEFLVTKSVTWMD